MEFDHRVTAMIVYEDGPFPACATCDWPIGRALDWTWRHLDDKTTESWRPLSYEELMTKIDEKDLEVLTVLSGLSWWASGDSPQNGTRAPQDVPGAPQTPDVGDTAKQGFSDLGKFTLGNLETEVESLRGALRETQSLLAAVVAMAGNKVTIPDSVIMRLLPNEVIMSMREKDGVTVWLSGEGRGDG